MKWTSVQGTMTIHCDTKGLLNFKFDNRKQAAMIKRLHSKKCPTCVINRDEEVFTTILQDSITGKTREIPNDHPYGGPAYGPANCPGF